MTSVQQVRPDEWRVWRLLRLAALAEAPQAFASTLSDWTGVGDTEARWRDRLISVPANFVALVNGTPAGQVSAARTAEDDVVELIGLWVSPDARNLSVGRSLIEAVIAWATTQEVTTVCLRVNNDNHVAARLYERCGFSMTGSVPIGDEHEMILHLKPS